MSHEALRRKFEEAGQGQVFRFYDQLNPKDKEELIKDVKDIDLAYIDTIYKKTVEQSKQSANCKIARFPQANICNIKGSEEQRKRWEQLGIEKISEGKVGTLLLAGGQGTRLGTVLPKGMYNIGLPSNKTLYEIQAERLLRLQNLVQQRTQKTVRIPWYIMTSEATAESTRKFFENHGYFGLKAEDVIIFEQNMLPCLTPEGKIILESKKKVARAPNGNGGLYEALKQRGIYGDMDRRGIELIYQYCVDNSLIKMADPIFVGYCFEKQMDCAAKVVAKLYPKEPVGLLCVKEGKPGVVEYSEIDETTAQLTNPDGSLYYNEAHICMNAFSVNFLKQVSDSRLDQLPFHIAKKKIPAVNDQGDSGAEPVNGWKLELFIFDVFEFAKNMFAFEVERSEEFSPLKNGPGVVTDSPETCRRHVSDLHKRIITRLGASIEPSTANEICEISPLLCCSPEDVDDLKKIVSGKTFRLPTFITASSI